MEDDLEWAQHLVADAQSNISLLAHAFNAWKRISNTKKQRANQFAQWKIAHIKHTLTRIHTRHRILTAFNAWKALLLHHRTQRLKNALQKWLDFVHNRRRERHLRDIAVAFWRDRLLFRTFYPWKRVARIAARARAREAKKEVELRRLFKKWRMSVALKQKTRRNVKLALFFRYNVLLGSAFYAWFAVSHDRIIRSRHQAAAMAFRSRRLQRSMFNRWHGHVEDVKQRRLRYVRALVAWSSNLERRCFLAWVQFTADRIRHANNMHIAKVHFRLRRKRIGFDRLRSHAEQRRVADRAMLAAAALWEDRRRARALRMLRENAESTRAWVVKLANAESFHRRLLVRRYWRVLRRFSDKMHLRTLTAKNRSVVLVEQREQRAQAVAFKAWVDWVQRRAQRKLNVLRADAIRHRRLKQRSFLAWQEWSYTSRTERIVKRHVLYLFARSRLKKLFSGWKSMWLETKEQLQAAEGMAARRELSVKQEVVALWKALVDSNRAWREREKFAMEWRRKELVKNGVRVWMTNSMNFKMQKEAMLQQQSALKATLVMKRVAKYAQHWRRVTLERKLQREKFGFEQRPAYSSSLLRQLPTLSSPPTVQLHEPKPPLDLDWMQPRSKPRPKPRKFVGHEDVENLVDSMNQP